MQNNQIGATWLAQNNLDSNIANQINNNIMQLNWAQGFFSKTVCDGPTIPKDFMGPLQKGETRGGPSCSHTSIQTPGSQVKDAVSQAVGSDFAELINTQDIDQIINALMGQLMNLVTSGIGGLAGANTAGPGGVTPLAQILGNTIVGGATGGNTKSTLSDIKSASSSIMHTYLPAKKNSLKILETASTTLLELIHCENDAASSTNSDTVVSTALANSAQAVSDLNTNIVPLIWHISADIYPGVPNRMSAINYYYNELKGSTTIASTTEAIQDYSAYETAHATDVLDAQNQLGTIKDEINPINTDALAKLKKCGKYLHSTGYVKSPDEASETASTLSNWPFTVSSSCTTTGWMADIAGNCVPPGTTNAGYTIPAVGACTDPTALLDSTGTCVSPPASQ